VGGTHLAGTLDLSLLNGFVPSLGQTCFFLGAGWTYRTFRCPGPVPGDSGEFMHVRISK